MMVCPLRLEDGSTVLVNRGHLPAERVGKLQEFPEWVRVRGVLERGEIPSTVQSWARLKNKPSDGRFLYMVAEDLAEGAGARNHTECAKAFVTAYEVMFEDDAISGEKRENPYTMRHKEDYLLFWADEHTHFNYAMQWFGLGSLIFGMTLYKFVEVYRWRW